MDPYMVYLSSVYKQKKAPFDMELLTPWMVQAMVVTYALAAVCLYV